MVDKNFEAYRKIYNELIDIDLFTGVHDSDMINEDFMKGIGSVMHYIAAQAGYADEFAMIWDYNMRKEDE